ncbi:MAG: DUF5667 domain-containing protein, partial [Chloroflexota bacterium]|nr:DUF5667 domain-containing protein [Chloroflexota bacterium]
MQFEERSVIKGLPDALDQALAQLQAGESVEATLEAFPQYAAALEPLLRAGDRLRASAAEPLPLDLEHWLPTGARDFAAIAEQMVPKYTRQSAASRARVRANALDQALARIQASESLEASLSDHPALSAELVPLLRASAQLRTQAAEPLPLDLERWLPTGARDFAMIAEQMAPRYARRRAPASRPLTLQRTAIAVAIVAAMMGAVDTASAQSLPGETLYQWKRAKEDISLALVTDSDRRSHLLVEYAGRRLNEFNQLVDTGKSSDSALVAQTLDSMFANLAGALDEDKKNQSLDVTPEASQLLAEAKSEIAKAGPIASPDTVKVLDDAAAKANQLAQQMPPVTSADVAPASTSTPTETAVVALQPTDTATASKPGAPSPTNSADDSAQVPALTPSTVQPVQLSPTPAIGLPTSTPIEVPATPENTPTFDPATAIPPTVGPTDALPPDATDTSVPAQNTPVPSSTPLPISTAVTTNTVVPSATPVPITEEPTDVTLPTTVTPRPTRTPTNTPTPVPT